MKALVITLLTITLTGCGGWFSKKPEPTQSCIAECPDLVKLRDDTFGATTSKLKEVADTYYNCRKACQGPAK